MTATEFELDPAQSFAYGIAHLRAFAARENHTRVLRNHHEAYFALGRWVEDIRSRRDQLDVAQSAQLDSIPQWSWKTTATRQRRDSEPNFDAGYLVMLDYVKANGTARVPQMINGEVSELSRWVKSRRFDYKAGRLSNEQKSKLASLPGWVWDEQFARFLDSVERLKRYLESHRSTNVPPSYRDPADGYSLGQWVRTQRLRHSDNELDSDRVRALEEVPGWHW